MKKPWVTVCSAFSLAAAAGLQAEKIDLGSAPAPVQQTIRAEAGNAPIEDLDRESRDGKTIYEAAFKRNGVHTEIQVNADGTLVTQPAPPAAEAAPTVNLQNTRKVEFNTLPALAQRTVRSQSRNAVIEDVEVGTFAGRTAYEVAYKDALGQHREIIVSQEGVMLHPQPATIGAPVATPAPAVAAQPGAQPIGTPIALSEAPAPVRTALTTHSGGIALNQINKLRVSNNDYYHAQVMVDGKQQDLRVDANGNLVDSRYRRTTASKLVPLSQARKIQLNEVPVNLQTQMRREAGQARIEDIDVGKWNGQNVYQVAFKSNDKHTEVQFLEDGHLLADQRMDRVNIGVGAAPDFQAASETQANLGNAKIEYSQLPGTVQQAIRAHAGAAPIEDIDRRVVDGKVHYEVGYKVNGVHTELKVDSDGKILQE